MLKKFSARLVTVLCIFLFAAQVAAHCMQIFDGQPAVRTVTVQNHSSSYPRERVSAPKALPQSGGSGTVPPFVPQSDTAAGSPDGFTQFPLIERNRKGDLQRELTEAVNLWSSALRSGSLPERTIAEWHAFRAQLAEFSTFSQFDGPEAFVGTEFGSLLEFGPMDANGQLSVAMLIYMLDAIVSSAEIRSAAEPSSAALEAIRRLVLDKETLSTSGSITIDGDVFENAWVLLNDLTAKMVSAADAESRTIGVKFLEIPSWTQKRILGQSFNALSVQLNGADPRFYFESPFEPILSVTGSRNGLKVEAGNALWDRYIEEVDQLLSSNSTDRMLLASVLVRADGDIVISLPTAFDWEADSSLNWRCESGPLECQIRLNVGSRPQNALETGLGNFESAIELALDDPDSPFSELVALLRSRGTSLTLYSHPLQEASSSRLSTAIDFVSRMQIAVPDIDVLIDDFGPELESHVVDLVSIRPMAGDVTLLVPNFGYGRPFDGLGEEVRKIEEVANPGIDVVRVNRLEEYSSDVVSNESVVVLTAHNDDDFQMILEDFGAKGLFREKYVVLFACGIDVSSAQISRLVGQSGARGVFNFSREIRPDIAGDAIRELSSEIGRNEGSDLNEMLVRAIASSEGNGNATLSGAWFLCG